jgi:hypothetical protein
MFDRTQQWFTTRVVVLVAVSALSLVATSSALATTGHRYAGQFGGAGNGAGDIGPGGPQGIAVRQSTGDVFVTDGGHTLADGFTPAPRIERFNAAGEYQSSIGIDGSTYNNVGALAIDPAGSAAVYVSAFDAAFAPVVLKYTAAGVFVHALDVASSGTSLGNPALGTPAAVAVDPANGMVYATASDVNGNQLIDSFDQTTGIFIASFDGSTGPSGAFGCPTGLAADASHKLYVLDPCNNRVDQYAAGAFVATIDDGTHGSPAAVGVDPTSGDVFVGASASAGVQITEFATSGAIPPQSFGIPHLLGVTGVAVNHTTGSAYAADNGSVTVQRYNAYAGPTVVTTPSAAVSPTSETLNGTVNPGGAAATFHFEYGLDTNYGTSTTETSAGSGNSADPVSDTATPLIPNTTYHYRTVGANDLGSIVGNDQTFTTAAVAPTVDGTLPFATDITAAAARLNVTVNPNGSDTYYRVEYGTTTAYGSTAPQPDGYAGAGSAGATFPVDVDGLTPSTVYHFRIVADNGTGGLQTGADATLTTAPGAPAGATSVTAGAATLTGTINPLGSATTYHFEYGVTGSYGSSTPESDGGSGSGDEVVSAPVTGLTPSTTYHVRVVATTGGHTVTGNDGTFRTAAAPAAKATNPTGVSPSAATLNGTADTRGRAGFFRFLVTGADSTYVKLTDAQPVPGGAGAQPVSTVLSDLPSGHAYQVVLRVTSNDATTISNEVVFSTPPDPPAVPQPPADVHATGTTNYGCAAPVLNAYNARPKPGESIAITGQDLGVGGTVALGDDAPRPVGWSATGFAIQVPDDASGVLPLTVNCGALSNTIAITLFKAPSNTFTVKTSIKGSTATLKVDVPGAGALTASGKSLRSTKASAKKAGVVTLKIKLSAAASRSLARHHRLKATATVRFTPTGGAGRSKSVSLSFKR